jgi:hypothetical protein
MDYQGKIMILAVVLLILMAIYFVATAEQPETGIEQPANDSQAKELLMKGLMFGKGITDYTYAYTENADGFITSFSLSRSGGRHLVQVSSPLSSKRIFFLENSTILCVAYPPGSEECSVVTNNDQLDNYLESLRVKFFNDTRMEKATRDMNYLLLTGFAKLDPGVEDMEGCGQVGYRLDYSTATVADAARFGISTTSPKVFDMTMCIDNETGHVHRSTFNYTHNGRGHEKVTELVSFSTSPAQITEPENLTSNVFSRFEREREQQVKLVRCFTDMDGQEQERCIATIALNLKRKDLCELAGARRDRCLVSIVPSTRDTSICPMVDDLSFRDDCYIELAGGLENSTYCDSLQNASKMDFCLKVAEPEEDDGDLFNDTQDFLDYVEAFGQTKGNESNSTS